MRTSGHGNDTLMVLVPVGVLVGVGVLLAGGPMELLEASNSIVVSALAAVVSFARTLR